MRQDRLQRRGRDERRGELADEQLECTAEVVGIAGGQIEGELVHGLLVRQQLVDVEASLGEVAGNAEQALLEPAADRGGQRREHGEGVGRAAEGERGGGGSQGRGGMGGRGRAGQMGRGLGHEGAVGDGKGVGDFSGHARRDPVVGEVERGQRGVGVQGEGAEQGLGSVVVNPVGVQVKVHQRGRKRGG